MDDNPFGDPTPVAPKAAAPATPPPAAKAPTDPDAPLLPLITKIREIVKTTDDKFGGAQLRPLLMKSGIPVDQLKQVWALADVNKRGSLDLAELKLALRLIALAQDGRAIDPQAAAASRDLVPHFPSLDALAASAAAGGSAPATNNRTSVISSSSSPAGPAPSSSTSSLASPASPTTHRNSLEVLESFQELLDREHVTVTVAEKGTGMFSTTFYTVVSRAHGSTVTRRYSDFDWLHEVLLKRYPFRLIPEMPGKKLINKGATVVWKSGKCGQEWAWRIVGSCGDHQHHVSCLMSHVHDHDHDHEDVKLNVQYANWLCNEQKYAFVSYCNVQTPLYVTCSTYL